MWLSPKDGDPIRLNDAFFILCAILRFVVASAAEAELGALFLNCKEGMIFHLTLKEIGHPQPKTPIHCDNATAVGIANNTIKGDNDPNHGDEVFLDLQKRSTIYLFFQMVPRPREFGRLSEQTPP